MKNIFLGALWNIRGTFAIIWLFLFALSMAGKTPYHILIILGATFICSFIFCFMALLVAYLYYEEEKNNRLNKE